MTPISLGKAWGPLSPMSAKSDKAAPKKPREHYKAVCISGYDDYQKIDVCLKG